VEIPAVRGLHDGLTFPAGTPIDPPPHSEKKRHRITTNNRRIRTNHRIVTVVTDIMVLLYSYVIYILKGFKKNKNIHTELTRIVSLYGILAKNIHTDFLSLSLECRDLSLSFLKSGRNCLTSTSKENRLGWKG
jgi:hypothetical protein